MGRVEKLGMEIYPHLPYQLKNLACSLEGYRLRRMRFGGNHAKYLNWLEESQWWSLDEQLRYQLEQLRLVLAAAEKNVPYYRELFKSIGFCCQEINCIEDLKLLPILQKSDVQKYNESFVSEAIPRKDLVKYSTSGTTGTPLTIMTTPSCIQKYFALPWRQKSWFNVNKNMSHASFNGRQIIPQKQQHPPFWCQNWVGRQTFFSIYHMSPANLPAYAMELMHRREYVVGYPSSLFMMSKYLLEENIRLPWRPIAIFTSSETLLDEQREAISQAFRAPVADYYGMGEMVGSACECAYGRMHFDFEVGIMELVPVGDEPNVGRMICTGLINDAMPFIRYDTQDIVHLSCGTCPCGRRGLTAEKIDGRIESFIRTPEGLLIKRISSIFRDLPGIREGQIIQTEIDRLKILIVKAPTFSKREEDELLSRVRSKIGLSMRVKVEYVEQIPRERNGKLRAVISKLNKDVEVQHGEKALIRDSELL